jgi:hypothetical protein
MFIKLHLTALLQIISEQSYHVFGRYDEHTGVLVFRCHVLYYLSDTVFTFIGTQHFATDLVLFGRVLIVTGSRNVNSNHCATGGIIQNL